MIMGEGWEAFANEHGGLQQNVILFEYLGSSMFNVTFIAEGRVAIQVREPRYDVIPVTFCVPFIAPHTSTKLVSNLGNNNVFWYTHVTTI